MLIHAREVRLELAERHYFARQIIKKLCKNKTDNHYECKKLKANAVSYAYYKAKYRKTENRIAAWNLRNRGSANNQQMIDDKKRERFRICDPDMNASIQFMIPTCSIVVRIYMRVYGD